MCFIGKQLVNKIATIFATFLAVLLTLGTASHAQEAPSTAGGVMMGENLGGYTDRVWVLAPPGTPYVMELKAGNFLDCGGGQVRRTVDASGRDEAPLQCGVSITEIIHLPNIGSPARVIIHY